MDDVANRQRNIVFPDTVRNEGEFYRGIANRPLRGWVEKLGFVLLGAMALLFIGGIVGGLIYDAHNLEATTTVKILYAASQLAMIGGGTAIFITGLYLAVRHGVNKFHQTRTGSRH